MVVRVAHGGKAIVFDTVAGSALHIMGVRAARSDVT